MNIPYTLRPLTPDDAPAVAALNATGRPTTGGLIRLYSEPHPDTIRQTLANGHTAVVAEVPGYDGIAGIAWTATGECWFEGAVRPFAYLYGARVHPDYRRRGLMSVNTAYRLAKLRERFGSDLVALARYNPTNYPSLKGADRWSEQGFEGPLVNWAVLMRRLPPRRLAGVEVRPVTEADLEAYAAGMNQCYREHNFYPPRQAEFYAAPRQAANRGLVATDARGNLLAGLFASEMRRAAPMRVEFAHPILRWAAVLAGAVSPEGMMGPLVVREFWQGPGQGAAAAHLWQQARWRWRELGQPLVVALDTRTAVAQAVRPSFPRRAVPSVLRLVAPVQIDPAKPIYAQHI